MVPSSNFNQIYLGVEYTFLPNLEEINGGKGAKIKQNMSKIGRN